MIDTHAHLDACRGPAVGADQTRARRPASSGSSPWHRHRLVPSGTRAGRPRTRRCSPRSASTRTRPATRRGEPRRRAARALAEHDRAVAVGETGLDYFRDHAPRDDGSAASSRRSSSSRPSSASPSSSTHATRTPTRPPSSPGSTALSSCTASRRRACWQTVLERGYYVSFAGNVTYPKAADLASRRGAGPGRADPRRDGQPVPRAAAAAAAGRTSRRTSSTPLAALAEARGEDAAELGAQIDANAAAAFSLP